MMELVLLPTGAADGLDRHYKSAMTKAVELYIVSAYLTEWKAPALLNANCRIFRLIVGQDFCITRKQACRDVMSWIPGRLKHRFMVANKINGFHPKAMFWREANGTLHALIGSSNLTRAAFSTNHEVNVYLRPSKAQFAQVRQWIESIVPSCVAVSDDWLDSYTEAPRKGSPKSKKKSELEALVEALRLPRPAGTVDMVRQRREQLANYGVHRASLMKLFKACAGGRLSNSAFYDALPSHWSAKLNNRLQGAGWERKGKGSDFQKISQSFLRIVDASDAARDDVVAEEIDWLHSQNVSSRTAFLSEMLCLRFPTLFPIKNQPVLDFLEAIKFKGPRGASEGAAYVDLAQRLRVSLLANPKHPAKTIAELDAVLWLAYGSRT